MSISKIIPNINFVLRRKNNIDLKNGVRNTEHLKNKNTFLSNIIHENNSKWMDDRMNKWIVKILEGIEKLYYNFNKIKLKCISIKSHNQG